MTARRAMDRKAKLAIWLLVAIVAVMIFAVAHSLVTAMRPVSVVAKGDSGDDQLVVIGGDTEYLGAHTFGGKIVSWLNTGAHRTQAFTLGERNFKPDTADPTEAGWARLNRLAGLLQSNQQLKAHLYVVAYEGGDAVARQALAQKRAQRVETEILNRGIDPSRITAATQLPPARTAANAAQPTMVIVLSK